MTTPSAIVLLDEIRQLGGRLRAKEGGKLGVVLTEPDLSRLLPAVRERKPDLLVLLRYPATAGGGCCEAWR